MNIYIYDGEHAHAHAQCTSLHVLHSVFYKLEGFSSSQATKNVMQFVEGLTRISTTFSFYGAWNILGVSFISPAFTGTTIPRNNPKYPRNNPEITEATGTAKGAPPAEATWTAETGPAYFGP